MSIDGAGITLNSAFLRPRSRGTVTLATADPGDAPLIDPNYWSDPLDLEMSLRGLQMAREILRQTRARALCAQGGAARRRRRRQG